MDTSPLAGKGRPAPESLFAICPAGEEDAGRRNSTKQQGF